VPVALFTEHVLEFRIDGEKYWGGAFFAFRRAPLVVWLRPGRHVLEVRVVRDVRSMGGLADVPSAEIALEAIVPEPAPKEELGPPFAPERSWNQWNTGKEHFHQVEVREGSVIVSDAIDGKLVSEWASVALTNVGDEEVYIGVSSGDQVSWQLKLRSLTLGA
jgi:hypothetical protein